MNTTTLIGIIVAVIVIAGAGAYLAKGGPTQTMTTSATPTSSTTTSTPTTTTTTTTSPKTTTTSTSTSTTPATTTTSTTSTTTSTQTQTKTTTTTTTTPITTTTTTTSTSQTTTAQEEIIETWSSYIDFVKAFKHIQYTFEAENATTGEHSMLIAEYTQSPDQYNGQPAVRIDITVSSEGSNETLSIWATSDFQQFNKIEISGGEGPTQSLEGPTADVYARQILSGLFGGIVAFTHELSVEFAITEGKIASTKAGWTVLSADKTTYSVSGKDYPAWDVKVRNDSDETTQVSQIEFTIANLYQNAWVLTYIKDQYKDGSWVTVTLTELETA